MTLEVSYTADDVARLRALVTQLDQLLGPAPAPASVNPDGTPGPVAAGELIESAWGNAVASTIAGLPRGVLARVTKGTDQGGFGASELATGLAVTVPATPASGRLHTVRIALQVVQTTPPPAGTVIYSSLRLGSAAGASAGTLAWPFVDNASVNGRTLSGEFYPTGLTAGATYVVTTGSDGAGRYTVKGASWAVLDDVT